MNGSTLALSALVDSWPLLTAAVVGAVPAALWHHRRATRRITAERERTLDLLHHHVRQPLLAAHRKAIATGDALLATGLHAALSASEDLTVDRPRPGDARDLIRGCVQRAQAACATETAVTIAGVRQGIGLRRSCRAPFEEVVHEALVNALRHGSGPVRVGLDLAVDALVLIVHNPVTAPITGANDVEVAVPGGGRGSAAMVRTVEREGGSLAALASPTDHTLVVRWPTSAATRNGPTSHGNRDPRPGAAARAPGAADRPDADG